MSRPVGATKYSVNNEFFSKPNVLNCYWAGFLAADAALNPDRNNVRLGISTKDEEHLKRFRNDICFNGPVRYSNDLCIVEVYSVRWRQDLRKNFNITPRKTFTLMPPAQLTYQKALAFVAGYIDGDGCIGTYQNTNGRSTKLYDMPTISVLGTKSITQWICSIVNHTCGSNERSAKPFKRDNVYQYSFYGKRAVVFADQIRQLSIPVLDRKWSQV